MKLTPKHHQAIVFLASGLNQIETAEQLNVSRETIGVWKNDIDFSNELNGILKINKEAVITKLHSLAGTALETIEEIMLDKNTPARDRLMASFKILELLNIRVDDEVKTASENNKIIIEIEKGERDNHG